MHERYGLALVMLLPVTLPTCLVLGWISRHLLQVALGYSQAELGYSLFFAALPAAVALLVGGGLVLTVLPLFGRLRARTLGIAATANLLSYLSGLVLYNAPVV